MSCLFLSTVKWLSKKGVCESCAPKLLFFLALMKPPKASERLVKGRLNVGSKHATIGSKHETGKKFRGSFKNDLNFPRKKSCDDLMNLTINLWKIKKIVFWKSDILSCFSRNQHFPVGKTNMHTGSAVNTRVTHKYCVQYMFQKSFVTRGLTHSHISPVIGSTFGQQ